MKLERIVGCKIIEYRKSHAAASLIIDDQRRRGWANMDKIKLDSYSLKSAWKSGYEDIYISFNLCKITFNNE